MKHFTILDLEQDFPDAYAALPESYKEDSCLTFFVDINGNICSEDEKGNQYLFLPKFSGENDFPLWISIA